jgi:hypothetical protein
VNPFVHGEDGNRPWGPAAQAAHVGRSAESDGQLVGRSQPSSGSDGLSPVAPRGLSVGQWGEGIGEHISLPCAAEAFGSLVV